MYASIMKVLSVLFLGFALVAFNPAYASHRGPGPCTDREEAAKTIAGWGEFEVFINGTPAGTRFGSAGKIQIATAPSAMTKALRVGLNVVALHGVKLRSAESVRLGVYYFPPEPVR